MKYKSMPRTGNVSSEIALIQGLHTLDAAATVAEQTQDVEGLLNVAAMWMRFGEVMDAYANGVQPSGTEDKVFVERQFETGFGISHHEDEIAADEEENND